MKNIVLFIVILSISCYTYSQTEKVAIGLGAAYAMPTAGFSNYVKNGYEVEGKVLFAIGRNTGLDFSVSNGRWELKDGISGWLKEWTILPGIRYFANWNSFIPYVSASMGVQINSVDIESKDSSSVYSDTKNNLSDNTVFAVQFGTGFIFHLSDRLCFDCRIRYRFVRRSDFASFYTGFIYNIF